ncbi:MAG: 50S ribosomal protein L25 [Candidatus Amesbacteria bacterium GW2011_GWA2_42_12]|uniref:Large ribosomal subunit protein bL25 n=1 Tax=Candidatus Amesbacteria bacterium GW2011_GWA2_42_12 TaxID=1618356 RepID=A0A0G1B6S3_9BACT|nr:MAG: 50S ribosomal protein L25 [Candidatus Amesbacteria bacterium GW2011_GWA2_42_12]
MTKHTLQAKLRKIIGRKVKTLRAAGIAPANIFGSDTKSVSIQVSAPEFSKLYKQVGESTLVYLQIEGEKEPRPVMVHEVRKNPVSGQVQHVDFHQVNLKEKVVASVPLVIVGESLAQKDGLGILVQPTSELEIEALPTEMPQNIEVDVSKLSAVNESVTAKDIKLSSGLTLKSDPEAIVAKIEPLAAEEPKEIPVETPIEGAVTPEASTDQVPASSDQSPEPAQS